MKGPTGMGDYNLDGLNARDFEHLTQTLAIKYIAHGITPFGDGPDGGREATYQGVMVYPSTSEPWNGYLVIQSKFLKRPTRDTAKDGNWAISQLKADLDKFTNPKRGLPKPEYYLFVTNVVLTSVQDSGTKDKAFALLEQYKNILGLKGYDIWDYDKLCRFIDGDKNTRACFAGFITTGDVLTQVMSFLEGQLPDFPSIISLFLQNEMRADQFVKLEQAGNTADQKTPLAQVFVDLPVSEQVIVEPPRNELEDNQLITNLVSRIMQAGGQILKSSVLQNQPTITPVMNRREQAVTETGRYVIIGGPGQGKSTISQFIAQIYRAALLDDRPKHTLSYEAQSTLEFFKTQCKAVNVELPTIRRFPVRVVLDQFATSLANGTSKSLLTFILHRIKDITETPITIDHLRSWLANYPWLIVLDGLDEVPPTSNRKQVLERVTEFWSEVATLDADVLIIATTRPQGYNDDFSPRYYKHLYLTPLSENRALHYATRLAEAQHSSDPDRRNKILTRLKMACEQETTQRLMRSPLQVTIMATLVDRIGQPPQERWRLFRQYYEVIYQRETERDIPASRILQQRKADVNTIHYRVGLLLQAESEHAGSTDSKLPPDRFKKLVYERISEEGHEGKELEERTKEITEAALHRLVFLVGLESDRIGFEIRSLQEFMAAEALMNGKEEQVRARLEAIAPIVHWRNVFLFAAGNCFAERQFLRDMIITLCEQLNDPQDDKLAGLTLAGSRLALDILDDGVAREQPKYARSLAKIAILLTTIPDVEANQRLASVYSDHLEQVFLEQIERCLAIKDFSRQMGGWILTLSLIDKGVEWSIDLAERYWPTEINHQYQILEVTNSISSNDWVTRKTIPVLPALPVWSAFSLRQSSAVYHGRINSEKPLTPHISDTPAWFEAIESLVLREYREMQQPSGINTVFKVNETRVGRLHLTPINSPNSSEILALQEVPFKHISWSPYTISVKFLTDPNRASLSKSLLELSANWEPGKFFPYLTYIPWPLYSCITAAASQNELKAFAERAANGDFGDTDQWLSAEERWANQGVSIDDLRYLDNKNWPYNKNISEIGFPFSGSHLNFLDFTRASSSLFDEILLLFNSLQAKEAREWAANVCLNIVSHSSATRSSKISVAPSQLKELLLSCKMRSYYRIDSILLPKNPDKEWIDFVDWFGNTTGISTMRRPFIKQQPLTKAYQADPKRRGILLILASFVLGGQRVQIPEHVIRKGELNDPESRLAATLIRISQANWSDHDANLLAQEFVKCTVNKPWFIEQLGWTVNAEELRPKSQEPFFIALRDILASQGTNDLPSIHRALNAIMRSRTSSLNKSKKWRELGLPNLP